MRDFRLEAAKGEMTHTIGREIGDDYQEIEVTVRYYFEPAWAPSWDDPGSGASASFTVIKPEGLQLSDAELDEIEQAIMEHEHDRQLYRYEQAAEMAAEDTRNGW